MPNYRLALLAVLILTAGEAAAEEQTGTLLFDLRPYTSSVTLKKNIKKQLDRGGLKWGLEGNVLVIPLVGEQFVQTPLPHLTRYGKSTEIELPAGDYVISAIGYEQKELSRNVDKVLSASAFFNEEILAFTIRAGEKTTVEIQPQFVKTGKLVKVFIPRLHTRILVDNTEQAKSLINERTESSVAWDDYSGPLKFVE